MGEKAAQKLHGDTGLPTTTSRRSGCGCSHGCVLSRGLAVCAAATRVSSHVLTDTDRIARAEKLCSQVHAGWHACA